MKGTTRMSAVVATVLIGTFALAPTIGSAKTEHRVTVAYRAATVELSENFPSVGSRLVIAYVGEIKLDGGKALRGAAAGRFTVSAGDLTSGLEAKGETTTYTAQGLWNSNDTGKSTVNSDGSITTVGEEKISNGSGIFKGATGTLTCTSSSSLTPGAVITGECKGTTSY